MVKMADSATPTTPPRPGASVPQRGNALVRSLCATGLRLAGWRFEGELPDAGKMIIVAAPHTSNWDFVIGMAGVFALGVDLHWMGKHTLFKAPFGGFMRWLGGLAIDRTAAHGVVEQVVEEFDRRDRLLLVVTPEGTRSKVARWKTGFWHIARGAGVPILLAGLDYRHKRLLLGPLVQPGESLDEDMAIIQARYSNVTPRRPELF
jgi:1-acyl-sn-glycerol-3-phosphate acyltransferase